EKERITKRKATLLSNLVCHLSFIQHTSTTVRRPQFLDCHLSRFRLTLGQLSAVFSDLLNDDVNCSSCERSIGLRECYFFFDFSRRVNEVAIVTDGVA